MARFVAGGQAKGRRNAPGGRPPRPVSPVTVRHVRATLRRALADAVRDGRVGRNAAADARPPYVPHRPVGYMSAPDVRRLLDATRDDPLGPIFALAASTGLRLGELLGLAWPDVDFAAGTVTVRRSLARGRIERWELAQPKTATSRRTIPLPSIARASSGAAEGDPGDRTEGGRQNVAGPRRPRLHGQHRPKCRARIRLARLPGRSRSSWTASRPVPRPSPLRRDADARRRRPAGGNLRVAWALGNCDHGEPLRRDRADPPPGCRRRDGSGAPKLRAHRRMSNELAREWHKAGPTRAILVPRNRAASGF